MEEIVIIDGTSGKTERLNATSYYEYSEKIIELIEKGFKFECHLKNEYIEPNKKHITIMKRNSEFAIGSM